MTDDNAHSLRARVGRLEGWIRTLGVLKEAKKTETRARRVERTVQAVRSPGRRV